MVRKRPYLRMYTTSWLLLGENTRTQTEQTAKNSQVALSLNQDVIQTLVTDLINYTRYRSNSDVCAANKFYFILLENSFSPSSILHRIYEMFAYFIKCKNVNGKVVKKWYPSLRRSMLFPSGKIQRKQKVQLFRFFLARQLSLGKQT